MNYNYYFIVFVFVSKIKSVDNLHSNNGVDNLLGKENTLNEKGEKVNGRGDTPNRHDILTGSNRDGTLYAENADTATCGDW